MSNKRKKIKVVKGFKGDCPKAPMEYTYDDKGNITGHRQSSHIRDGHVYHVTKGWKVLPKYNPLRVLNILLSRIGLHPVGV